MTPKKGETYECPWCAEPMRKHDGPWAVWHCLDCKRSYGTWRPTDPPPKIIKADVKPVDPWADIRPQIISEFTGEKDE